MSFPAPRGASPSSIPLILFELLIVRAITVVNRIEANPFPCLIDASRTDKLLVRS